MLSERRTDPAELPKSRESWCQTTLGNFIRLQRGHDLTWRNRQPGQVPVMGAGGQNGFHNVALAERPGVVLGRSGASFGQAYFCNQDFWPHNTALYVTDFSGNNPLFVFYFLSHLDFSRHNSGGAQQSLNRNFIYPIPVRSPDVPEQEAIAEALSDADALIESLEQLIAKKRQIKQGVMQQLLTGRKRLPGFAGQFQETTLGKQAYIKTGGKNNEDKNDNGAYPFFVRSAYIERIDSYSHDCEAILVPGEGNIGDIFHYMNGRFDVHQRVYAITGFQPNTSAKFLYYYLSKYFGTWAMQNTVKATVDSLRLPTFLNFELRLPSTNKERNYSAPQTGASPVSVSLPARQTSSDVLLFAFN